MIQDPYAAFRFKVEIEGIQRAGFTACSGLQSETEVEEIREGGVNSFVRRLPKGTKYVNLTLKSGLTDSDDLWQWYQQVTMGKFDRRAVSVVIFDSQQKEKWRRTVIDAYPVKWVGPDLNAESASLAIETLEFAHHGFVQVPKK